MKFYFAIRRFILIILLFLFFSFNKTLPLIDESIFIAPIDINLYVAGAFGEPRGDHFHTGIDFSTRGKTGIPVHTIADGYVSRIKVQAGGYGHALYIIHPNGFMSVYGHLSKYADAIDQYVTEQQFQKKSFEVDLYPEKDLLKVKQGDEIAYSGNTGTSTAPHLHFEIRDAGGESFPLNPLKWIHIEDHKAPVINGLMIYQFNSIECLADEKLYSVIKSGNEYSIASTIIVNKSKTEIGIRAKDYMDASDADGDFGIYSIHSSIDGKEFYSFSLDKLDFSEGRYCNAHIDYAENKMKRIQIYRNFILSGNKASIYSNIVNRGIIELTDSLTHKIEILVKDYAGNTSVLKFKIKKAVANKTAEAPSKGFAKLFKWNEDNSYSTDSLKITMPSGNLYQDFYFSCKKKNHAAGKIKSPTYSVGDPYTPVHNIVTINILPTNIPEKLKSKTVICFRNYNGNVSGKTTTWNGNYCETKIREFGDYYVTIDTTMPTVTVLNLVANQTLTDNNIKVKITDNLSGVTKYNGYIDDEWILMELDFKSNILIWNRNSEAAGINGEMLLAGEHIFKLIVADEVGNTTTKTIKFKI